MAEKERKIEDILEELDAIVSEVENDVMPLEKMVDRITHASKLIQQCRKKLNAMNAKVELMFKDDGGQGEFTDFDPASERSQAAGAVEKNHASALKNRNSVLTRYTSNMVYNPFVCYNIYSRRDHSKENQRFLNIFAIFFNFFKSFLKNSSSKRRAGQKSYQKTVILPLEDDSQNRKH